MKRYAQKTYFKKSQLTDLTNYKYVPIQEKVAINLVKMSREMYNLGVVMFTILTSSNAIYNIDFKPTSMV